MPHLRTLQPQPRLSPQTLPHLRRRVSRPFCQPPGKLFDSCSPATTGPHAALQKLTRKRPLPDAIAPEPLLPQRENPALELLIGNMYLFLPEIQERAPAAMAAVRKKSNSRWRTYQPPKGWIIPVLGKKSRYLYALRQTPGFFRRGQKLSALTHAVRQTTGQTDHRSLFCRIPPKTLSLCRRNGHGR